MTDDTTSVNPEPKRKRGNYVKLQRSIWTDRDFTALSSEAQWLYLALISQPDITHVGIVPYMPSRWVRLSVDATLDATLAATLELTERNYVAVDQETGELWVRSYIVHDEAYRLTNGKKSLENAHSKVYSPTLRNLIREVLATVEVTVASTVDARVSAHKTETMRHEPAAAAVTVPVSSKPHPLRRKVLVAAAAEVIAKQGTKATNLTGLSISVADRLTKDHPDVDAWIDEHGEDGAIAMILEAEFPQAQSTYEYTPRDPEVALKAARNFGRAVKQQHHDNYGPNEWDAMRDSFIRELPWEARQQDDVDAWIAAATEAYDEYNPSNVRELRPA